MLLKIFERRSFFCEPYLPRSIYKYDSLMTHVTILQEYQGKLELLYIQPYAEIGATVNNSRFGLLLWGGGCFVCRFKFGCIQNIVSR